MVTTLNKMASKTDKPGVTVVNLSSLSLPQLDQLKNTLEEVSDLLNSSCFESLCAAAGYKLIDFIDGPTEVGPTEIRRVEVHSEIFNTINRRYLLNLMQYLQ